MQLNLFLSIKTFSCSCLARVIAYVSLSGAVRRESPGKAAGIAVTAHCNFLKQGAGLSHVPSESGDDKKFIFLELWFS